MKGHYKKINFIQISIVLSHSNTLIKHKIIGGDC